MSLPGHPIPGPDRERPDTMDHEVEAGAQRVRHHLRRPLAGSRNLLMKTAGNTVAVTDPSVLEARAGLPLRTRHSEGVWQGATAPDKEGRPWQWLRIPCVG